MKFLKAQPTAAVKIQPKPSINITWLVLQFNENILKKNYAQSREKKAIPSRRKSKKNYRSNQMIFVSNFKI
jgi:hypothetical protein